MPSTNKTVKVLTIHSVMGDKQIFNNQNYSWVFTDNVLYVRRKDKLWIAYFPCANIVKAEVQDVELKGYLPIDFVAKDQKRTWRT